MAAEDEQLRAVVDRIVDGRAVLLVGEDEEEHVVDADVLPEGAGERSWLIVRVRAGRLRVVGVDAAATEAAAADHAERLERIRRTRSGGRFGKTSP